MHNVSIPLLSLHFFQNSLWLSLFFSSMLCSTPVVCNNMWCSIVCLCSFGFVTKSIWFVVVVALSIGMVQKFQNSEHTCICTYMHMYTHTFKCKWAQVILSLNHWVVGKFPYLSTAVRRGLPGGCGPCSFTGDFVFVLFFRPQQNTAVSRVAGSATLETCFQGGWISHPGFRLLFPGWLDQPPWKHHEWPCFQGGWISHPGNTIRVMLDD